MKKAILLTGFNNWGKSTHIFDMFGGRTKFYQRKCYSIPGVKASFTVESHSNDDDGEIGFIDSIKHRISNAPQHSENLLCAFCPTREFSNDSLRILSGEPFSTFDEIHVLLLKYKWDFHAELRIEEIKSYLSPVTNIQFFTIDADAAHTGDILRRQARGNQIISYLQGIYP